MNTVCCYFIYILMNYLLVTRYLIQHKEMLVRCKNITSCVGDALVHPVTLHTKIYDSALSALHNFLNLNLR